MKFIVVFLLFTSCCVYVNAQPNLLGKYESDVVAKMRSMTNVRLIVKDTKPDGSYFIQYHDEEWTLLTYYFNQYSKCYDYKILYRKATFLPDMISLMNEQHIKVNDSTWVSKNYLFKVELTRPPSGAWVYLLEFKTL